MGNISSSTTEADLRDYFTTLGDVAELTLVTDVCVLWLVEVQRRVRVARAPRLTPAARASSSTSAEAPPLTAALGT